MRSVARRAAWRISSRSSRAGRSRRASRSAASRSPADDDGEQVVEVVGHAAGQRAHRLQLLGLAELLLQRPVGGHVAGVDHQAGHRRVGQPVAPGRLQDAPPAVAVGHTHREAGGGPRVVAEPPQGQPGRPAVLRVDPAGQVDAGQLLDGPAEQLGGAPAGVADPAQRIEDQHHVGAALGEGAEAGLAVAQGGGGPLLVGHVGEAEHAERRRVAQPDQVAAAAEQPGGEAAGADEADQQAAQPLAAQDALDGPALLRQGPPLDRSPRTSARGWTRARAPPGPRGGRAGRGRPGWCGRSARRRRRASAPRSCSPPRRGSGPRWRPAPPRSACGR